MQTSETVGNLFAAFVAAHAELVNPGKTATAEIRGQSKKTGNDYSMKYSYAPLDVVIDADRELLAKYKLAIIQSCGSEEVQGVLFSTVQSLLVHESGEWLLTDTMRIPGGNAQELGIAETYGRRYQRIALLDVFPTGEDSDAQEISGRTYGAAENTGRFVDANPDTLKLSFGKFKGHTLAEVDLTDHGYVEWLSKNASDGAVLAAAKLLCQPAAPIGTEPQDEVTW